jgi:hypothetical protein
VESEQVNSGLVLLPRHPLSSGRGFYRNVCGNRQELLLLCESVAKSKLWDEHHQWHSVEFVVASSTSLRQYVPSPDGSNQGNTFCGPSQSEPIRLLLPHYRKNECRQNHHSSDGLQNTGEPRNIQ